MIETTVRRSEQVAALGKALAAAQGEMQNPAKESRNPHFNSRYADLATVRDSVIPALSKHHLAVMQLPCEVSGGPALVTLLVHESGEWIETTMTLRNQKNDPQGIGSALTYCRRYALQSIAGVAADDDDDGNAAGQQPQQQRQQRPSQQQRPKEEGKKPEPEPQPDKPKDEATREKVVDGDVMTDGQAVAALAQSKGQDWASMIGSINTKFGTKYGVTRTVWVEVSREHREAAVAALNKMPDKVKEAPPTAADVESLVGKVAEAMKLTPIEVWHKLIGAQGWQEVVSYDDLRQPQIVTAVKGLRSKLAELQPKGGA